MSFLRTVAIRWYKLNKRFRHWRKPYRDYQPEIALRAELFSSEQMAEHGKQLANRHQLSLYKKSNQLLERLADNKAALVDCNELLMDMAQEDGDQRMTPVAEWLFDNYYLIEEQIHTAQRHLPKRYNRALPQLSTGTSAGLPRVYDLAMEAISHGDGRFDEESLSHFITDYQSIIPLALGELWAIPIMLRLALIENIRRVATRVMVDWHDRKLAMEWAQRIVETTEKHPKDLVLAVARMADSGVPLTSSFVAELARCLQGQNIASNLPLSWIEQSLSEANTNIEQLVQIEAQQQAADQVSISNSMASLRLLSAINWRSFVESLSIVEHILAKDPANIYPNMDFATRDYYRHIIEKLALLANKSEEETATSAISLAENHLAKDSSDKLAAHVGFYLMDKGLPLLKKTIGTRTTLINAFRDFIKRAPFTIYFFSIMLFTFLFAWPYFVLAKQSGWSTLMIILSAFPTLLVTGQLANSLINWFVMLSVSPSLLPRLDYSEGIPAESRTAVIVPTIIGHKDDVDELIEGLEVRFLANRDDHLYFGLLTDFLDANLEEKEGDTELLRLTEEGILALNRKYPEGEYDRFFLCHRPRRWNASENVWMGYERKRGKIAEFNALLRGSGYDRFALIVGDLLSAQNSVPLVHYVITLDTDTQLPRDAACQFVGTIAHPLNHAVYNPVLKRVTSGYAILQPRVGISLPSSSRSAYAELFGSDAGVDPYTRTVSDVYQDLFDEGSFIGKGIYDVEIFEQVIKDRFPENQILSHDLIEGCYARSGLLTDVQLYEEYPAHFSADTKRRHRWIRGDWQLLPWVFSRVPSAQGMQKNSLSWLSRWKIVDNLRRTLAPIALIAMLLMGWFGITNNGLWMIIISLMVFGLLLVTSLQNAIKKPRDIALNHHLTVTLHTLWQGFLRALLAFIWLPYETYYSLDAMIRTLYRITISRKNLLQWNPSREVERSSKNTLFNLYRQMWISPVLSIGIFIFLLNNLTALAFSLPLLLLWFASPAIAWWISRPKPLTDFVPTVDEQTLLRQLARQTWAFFDHFVGPKGNWLPPDNMQEEPVSVVAHRTSPTNMGMSLLAHLGAYDLGYLTAGRLLKRIDHSLTTMSSLERYRSHFYNWYDTKTLEPLSPRYISTVDSGNLAGHLLTLRPGILALATDPIFSAHHFTGLSDTLKLLYQAIIDDQTQKTVDKSRLAPFATLLEEGQTAFPKSISSAITMLQKLLDKASDINVEGTISKESDIAFWHNALVDECQDLLDELQPLALPDLPDPFDQHHALNTFSTWQDFAKLDQSLWSESQQDEVAKIKHHAKARLTTIEEIAQVVSDMVIMDFSFLYNKQRDLLTIGYNADSHRIDSGFYDLLASEVRLTHLVTIAQGQLPQDSWFALGRHLTRNESKPVLLSWTGSMFEYLMPLLVMPSFEGTLLDQTCRSAVSHQIEYGRKLGLPWGVSESGYNALDIHRNYQYKAFGVPGLGLKRGLGDDVVIAPYASVLALMVAPKAAYKNIQRLMDLGFCGRFGLYEAIDYTAERLPRGADHALISSYMAHHQGMSLVSIVNVLLDNPMQKRFKSNPQIKATTLLLQERIPKIASEYLHTTESISMVNDAARSAENKQRIYTTPNSPIPKTQLLSNGRYHVMVNSAGGGYSQHGNNAITRWNEDSTSDGNGQFCYLRDIESGEFWSNSYQPTLKITQNYEAIFTDSRAEFRVYEHGFDAHTEIIVSPEEDIELRRIHITNHNKTRRTIELTSYAEVVLAPALSDALHPAFSKLFIQTELHKELQAIVCTRRPRAKDEAPPWMFHLLVTHDATLNALSFETDRSRFIGRGRNLAHPAAMDTSSNQSNLSNSEGSVLDPIVAIRSQITIEVGQTVTVDLITGVANSQKNALNLIHKYRDRHLADRVPALAWTHSQVSLRQLNISLFDARLYERMATAVLYSNATLRASEEIITANQRNQSGLWGQAISGDLPIVLLQISDSANIELVIQLVQAHAYWRLKGLSVDLIIWNEDHASYRQHLQDLITGMLPTGTELIDRPGGIFVRPAQLLSREDRILIQSVARIIISDKRGSLSEQVRRRRIEPQLPSAIIPSNKKLKAINAPLLDTELVKDALILSNPYGGFSPDGREYIILSDSKTATPAPWSNVLANRDFGTLISESGSAYTWSKNAHEYRLTPWHNDPVSDRSGEALYIRDEESGHFWSPTMLPRRGQGAYITHHGFGYSVFEHIEAGIHTELTVYVALDTSIKFSLLKIHNISGEARSLSATGYVEWVLGDLRERSSMHVITESDPAATAIFAHNAYSMKHANQVTFFDVDAEEASITADRLEFLGRNGTLQSPAAMARKHLSGRTGAGFDPCGAIQVNFDLAAGQTHEIVFRLGAAEDKKSALSCMTQYRGIHKAKETLQKVQDYWRSTLSQVQVKTPDPSINVLANGWLMYQTIASRFWARSGYYQSGGAYGFRDQLQDSMAMVHAIPDQVREYLLLCASHQFIEGDVQHWWHPPQDHGVRTTCSDDYLWLPMVTSQYIKVTGDWSILDEPVNYIEGRLLNKGEESYYDQPSRSSINETLYKHCVRAIEHSMPRGVHGLPLIGCGDWNDGMNRVGHEGKGESIWLGFFLHDVLQQFSEIARVKNDEPFEARCLETAATLKSQLNSQGWDGAWYRRAYFDDGTPLGSTSNDECQIDSIAQSWSVLSNVAPMDRQLQAMNSLNERLVRRDIGIIQLFDPPFDRSKLDPGYIKGYVPGVRENGGQYTHAAIWAVMAFAALKDSARAWELMDMLNPVSHANSLEAIETYKVEPYVMSADVYAVNPHEGRGGWSWYTGSAGLMYRLIIESLLGLQVKNDTLMISPVLPEDWTEFSLDYRYHETNYHIEVKQTASADGLAQVSIDGVIQKAFEIPLINDENDHKVEIHIHHG